MAVLRDGKPRNFQQILSEVEFSYNTLRLHLAQLVEHDLVVRARDDILKVGEGGYWRKILEILAKYSSLTEIWDKLAD